MSDHIQENLRQASEAISRADFPRAIEILSGVVADDQANGEAWRNLGVCYLETRRPDLAVEALSRARSAMPAHAMTHVLLGHAYGSTGQLEQAAACYRHALDVDPDQAKAEEFLIKTESLLESREHYRNALKLLYLPDPTAQDLNHVVRELAQSVAIFEGSPARDNLIECARKLLALKAESPISQPGAGFELWAGACERGYQCIHFGNWAGARAAYEEALAYRVQDAFVHHALGFCFAELGETDDTVRAWLRVIELDSGYDFTRFGRVRRTQ
ncbi:MAG: tetratricopeptide repeat protein [Terriglobia bacterium]